MIPNADELNIAGLAKHIADLAERTRDNEVGPTELSGGTFTITNGKAVVPSLRRCHRDPVPCFCGRIGTNSLTRQHPRQRCDLCLRVA